MNRVLDEINQVFDRAASGVCADPPELRMFTCDELCDMRLGRVHYIVDTLLRPGLAVLAGSPKVGKSWLVLDLCIRIAAGLPAWQLATHKGSVLYIALEDGEERLQERVLSLADCYPSTLHFSLDCAPLGDALEQQLRSFVSDHPDTRLVVFDTFQKIRAQGMDMSYANDYTEVSRLKRVADELGICILLVHHTRKQTDSDFMNEISGTNGIAGSADTLMVLKKEKRSAGTAVLHCTGRDIEDRELTLFFNRDNCLWELKNDSLCRQPDEMPKELYLLVSFMMVKEYYYGTTAAFTEEYCRSTGVKIEPSQLKRLMNRYRYDLEDQGVSFATIRRKNARMLTISYCPPEPAEAAPDDGEVSGDGV